MRVATIKFVHHATNKAGQAHPDQQETHNYRLLFSFTANSGTPPVDNPEWIVSARLMVNDAGKWVADWLPYEDTATGVADDPYTALRHLVRFTVLGVSPEMAHFNDDDAKADEFHFYNVFTDADEPQQFISSGEGPEAIRGVTDLRPLSNGGSMAWGSEVTNDYATSGDVETPFSDMATRSDSRARASALLVRATLEARRPSQWPGRPMTIVGTDRQGVVTVQEFPTGAYGDTGAESKRDPREIEREIAERKDGVEIPTPHLPDMKFVLSQAGPVGQVFLHWKRDGEEECSIHLQHELKQDHHIHVWSSGFEPVKYATPRRVTDTGPFSQYGLEAVRHFIDMNNRQDKFTLNKPEPSAEQAS